MNEEPKRKISLGEVTIRDALRAMASGKYDSVSFDIRESEREQFEKFLDDGIEVKKG